MAQEPTGGHRHPEEHQEPRRGSGRSQLVFPRANQEHLPFPSSLSGFGEVNDRNCSIFMLMFYQKEVYMSHHELVNNPFLRLVVKLGRQLPHEIRSAALLFRIEHAGVALQEVKS